jgi:hypothetical protein
MPKRPKKRRGDEIAIRVYLDDILIYENIGEAIDSNPNTTRFRFPNDRIINLPDSVDDMKIVNRLLKDGIKLE